MQSRRRELSQFALVGALGFVVDASILMLLFQALEWPVLPARLLSFGCAATVTWWFNRNLTFRNRASDVVVAEWATYLAVNAVGAALNLGIFILLMAFLPNSGLYPLGALAAAATVAWVANYLGSRSIVFKRQEARREH